jgi:uncharacterized protein YndB with AHSA1/START domain
MLENYFSNKKKYRVHGAKFYLADVSTMFGIFSSMRAFAYTGADTVKGTFAQGEDFLLDFGERGRIEGNFLEIESEKRIVMGWSVTGFGRPEEKNTIVKLDFSFDNDMALIYLEHSGIPSKESKEAKTKAWKQLLEDLDKELKQH